MNFFKDIPIKKKLTRLFMIVSIVILVIAGIANVVVDRLMYEKMFVYEKERLAKTAAIVKANRKGGPERVIDEVEKRAPAGFTDIDAVLSHEQRSAIIEAATGQRPVTDRDVTQARAVPSSKMHVA